MQNPITQMLQRPKANASNNIFSQIATIKNILSGGDPNAIFEAEMQRNPQFAKFVNEHKNMDVNQLASQAGIDPSMLQMLFR